MEIVSRVGSWLGPLISIARGGPDAAYDQPFPPRFVRNDRWGYARYALAHAGCLARSDGHFPDASSVDFLDDCAVLFASGGTGDVTAYTDFLTGAGMQVYCRAGVEDAIGAAIAVPNAWGLLVLHLTGDLPMKQIRAKLRELRRRAPDMRVLLLAAPEVPDRSLISGRHPVADAVVRMPALLVRFEIGVVAALSATRTDAFHR